MQARMHYRLLPILFIAGACAESESLAPQTDSIVGGRDESAFVPVGALIATAPDGTYLGAYCTATLIRPHWLITAAHCVIDSFDDGAGGQQPLGLKYFFIGEDSRPANGELPQGAFVRVAEEIINPAYDPTSTSTLSDLALIRLYDEVRDVAPYPLDLSGVAPGDSLHYVGFGFDESYDPANAGRKRSTDLNVAPSPNLVQPSWFASYRFGTNICFGDSGGPALRNTGGAWYVVAINSAVFGTNPDLGQGPCDAGSLQVRVDFHAEWIASVLPNVSKYKCDGLYDCLVACTDPNNAACSQGCVDLTAPEGVQDFLPLNQCLIDHCTTSTSTTCLEDSCLAEYQYCVPTGG